MTLLKRLLLAALIAILPSTGFAQSLTTGCSSPPPSYGVVWTASQWIVCLSSLQANLGFVPLNSAGGSMSGELFVAPSVASSAPFNFPPGLAPSAPANGDLWFTSAGLYYRAGGVSVGPLASTTSQTFVDPTFSGTVTMPDASTFTSAGGQGFAHLYVNRTTDNGGGQRLQATGGIWAGTLGFATNGNGAAGAVSTAYLDYSSGARLYSTGASNSTYSAVTILQYHSDLSGSRSILNFDTSGNAQFTGTVSLGTTSTDYITAAGGGSGGTISTNGGSLTLSSGGGALTALSDTAVRISAVGYHNCSVVGTDTNGTFTCGGAPSGYITYNDAVNTNTAAVSGNLYCMDTSGGALTLTLPASPGSGAYVAFSDCGGNFGTNNLTIARNGSNIMYSAGNMTVSTPYGGGVLRYSPGKTSWILSPL